MDIADFYANQAPITAAQTARFLQELLPPRAVIVVGVNRDNRHLLDWPGELAENILLIDARPEALVDIKLQLPATRLWKTHSAVLAESASETFFYSTSNVGEDSLVPPQKLRGLWPNLSIIDKQACTTQTLQAVLAEPELCGLSTDNTWLVINCLPALRILRGADTLLPKCQVIWLRVTIDPLDGEIGTTIQEATLYLTEYNFRCILFFEENHPNIGQAIFMRDAHAQHEQILDQVQTTSNLFETQAVALGAKCDTLSQKNMILINDQQNLILQKNDLFDTCSEQLKLSTERLSQIHVLTQEIEELVAGREKLISERDQQVKIATDLLTCQENLITENISLVSVRDSSAKELRDLLIARDEQTKLADQRQAKIKTLTDEIKNIVTDRSKLTNERDQQNKIVADLNIQYETLNNEKASLLTSKDASDKERLRLIASLDEQAKMVTECQQHIDALTQEKDQLAAVCCKLKDERDHQNKILNDFKTQRETLISEKVTLTTSRDALLKEQNRLSAELIKQDDLTNERQIQLEVLNLDKDRITSEQATLIETLSTQLKEQADALDIAREKQIQLIVQRDQHLHQLKAELQESQDRLTLMQDELVRAEAQIELIKDLLLREPLEF